MSDAIKYADRKSGKICTENVMGDAALKFAYNTLLGRSLWGLLFGSGKTGVKNAGISDILFYSE